jgi:hypothetical protein
MHTDDTKCQPLNREKRQIMKKKEREREIRRDKEIAQK